MIFDLLYINRIKHKSKADKIFDTIELWLHLIYGVVLIIGSMILLYILYQIGIR